MNTYSEERMDEQQEDEYCNRVYYWYTQFKGSWCPINGFDPYGMEATEKDYDKACKPYMSHNNGKIIGSHKFETKEEFNEKILNNLTHVHKDQRKER